MTRLVQFTSISGGKIAIINDTILAISQHLQYSEYTVVNTRDKEYSVRESFEEVMERVNNSFNFTDIDYDDDFDEFC